MQKLPSLGSSPKSPPYAHRLLPSGSFWTRPWSHHSQMKPPCKPVIDSIASQYSPRHPLLLPIACEYSHIISGWRWLPERSCSAIAEMRGYIGQVMSLTDWSLDQ